MKKKYKYKTNRNQIGRRHGLSAAVQQMVFVIYKLYNL